MYIFQIYIIPLSECEADIYEYVRFNIRLIPVPTKFLFDQLVEEHLLLVIESDVVIDIPGNDPVKIVVSQL